MNISESGKDILEKFCLSSSANVPHNFNALVNYKELAGRRQIGHLSLDVMYPLYYLRLYPDLSEAFGPDGFWAARDHYWKYGRKEGRSPSPFFDPKYYLSLYPDLRDAFGDDYKKATFHWVDYGIKEGRRGSRVFHLKYYYDNNPDLHAHYPDNDYLGAFDHWKKYGHIEGRATTSDGPRLVIYNQDFSFGTIIDQPHFFGLLKDENRWVSGIGCWLLILTGMAKPDPVEDPIGNAILEMCLKPIDNRRQVFREEDRKRYRNDQALRNMYTV